MVEPEDARASSGYQTMKYCHIIVICLVGVLAIGDGACADDAGIAGNPYSPIATRNVFGLKPLPQTMTVMPAQTIDPPPKITVNGIMSILGSAQVLFKVLPQRNLATVNSCILRVGEQQDGVKILQIDMYAGFVVFNNHGVVQHISLADTPQISVPTTHPTPDQLAFQRDHPSG
jgi:hypothetical protein